MDLDADVDKVDVEVAAEVEVVWIVGVEDLIRDTDQDSKLEM
jgi:hypothetical protein